MTDAYAAAGVDTSQADRGVEALVGVLRTIAVDRPSASVLRSGHYASVLRVTPELGIALSTDGVGSKIVVAEQAGRLDTVGIDCVAMNVNDVVCVGAEPIAMLDYLAVERADTLALEHIARGLKAGAEAANVEIPGGELAVLPELIRGHPSPHGFDLCGTAIGTVALDAIVTGDDARPGDALVGLPSSGLHSNGYTLARRALLEAAGLGLDDRPPQLGGATVADVLLEPTVIYVRAVLDLLRSDVPVHGLAHITGGGLLNLLRLGDGRVGYAIERPLPAPPVFGLVAGRRLGARRRDVGGVQHGLRLRAVVPEEHADTAVEVLAARHPGTAPDRHRDRPRRRDDGAGRRAARRLTQRPQLAGQDPVGAHAPLGRQPPQLRGRARTRQVARRHDLGRRHRPEAPQRLLDARRGAGLAPDRQRRLAQRCGLPAVAHPVLGAVGPLHEERRQRDARLAGQRRLAGTVEVGPEGLDDGVRAHVDREPRDVEAREAPRDVGQRLGPVQLLAARHQALADGAQVGPVEALLGGRLHRQAGGERARRRMVEPQPRIDRHRARLGRLHDVAHASPADARTRAPAPP